MKSAVTILAILLLLLVAYFLSNIVPASGIFAGLEPLLVEQCRRVEIAPGTEDVTIDPETGLAFISAADRRAWFNDKTAGPAATNGIYVLNLSGLASATKVSTDAPADFLPHGISLWRGADGAKRLFVINHPTGGGEVVEIFDVGEGGALAHVESVSFDAMSSPNDLLAVGPRQFYATNDRGYESGIMGTLEAYLALPFSSVAFFDGTDGRIVRKGMTYANGINQSADGSTVYVAEFLKRRIAVFARDAASGALTKAKTIAVNTGPDNIEVAEDGALYVAGHSKVFDFLAHAKDAAKIAPSHVIRVDPATGATADVFISTKGEINASSVGAARDQTLIVGAVFDGHVMVCPLAE